MPGAVVLDKTQPIRVSGSLGYQAVQQWLQATIGVIPVQESGGASFNIEAHLLQGSRGYPLTGPYKACPYQRLIGVAQLAIRLEVHTPNLIYRRSSRIQLELESGPLWGKRRNHGRLGFQ